MTSIDVADLTNIAFGAAVLGTGGGGDPYLGRLFAERSIREHGPVEMVDLDQVPDDALVLPVAMMGAPTVMVEKIPSGDELRAVVRTVETRLGRAATHLVPIEAGGMNSLVPFAAAAQLGLPIVDADGMGRAFPELQQVMPSLGGLSATPMALADDKGNSAILDTVDNVWTERLARTLTVEMGCSAILANYAMKGSEAKAHLIGGTVWLAARIGVAVDEARAAHRDPVDAALSVVGGTSLFVGKVVDVSRRTTGGFARGNARLTGIAAYDGATLDLTFQNEHLVAIVDGEVRAVVPDLVCLFDVDSGSPVTTEALRYGLRVVVGGAPCDSRWKTPAGLEIAGPRAFGLDVDYRPIVEGSST